MHATGGVTKQQQTMKLFEHLPDERAVSPVVGVALMIAITVILAAVIGAVVLGMGTGGVNTPQAQLQAEWDGDDVVTITHNGGEPLPEGEVRFVGDDNEVVLEETLTTGASVTISQAEGDDLDLDLAGEITVIWDDPNSDSSNILERFSA